MTDPGKDSDVYLQTARSYNSIARDYAARHDSLDEIRDLLDRFACSLPRGGVILDAGCGHGRDAHYFTTLGYDVVGIDYSIELLRIALNRAPNARFAAADVRFVPFRDGTFDGVWMNAVLHHLQVPHILTALCESHRVLKEGGIFYTSFHLSSWEGWDDRYGEHRRFYCGASEPTVSRALQRAGLATICTLTRSAEDYWFHWFAERPRVPAIQRR